MNLRSPFSLSGQWYKGNLHTHTTNSDGLVSPTDAIAWYRDHGYDFMAISDHWVLTQEPSPYADFATVTATELHGDSYHLLVLGSAKIPPRSLENRPQEVIDYVKAQGALAYIAHPYWTARPSSEMVALRGLDGVEVYNNACEVTKGTGHARVHWDDCLSAGHRLVGLAVDDVHWQPNEAGGGFVMVRAPELSEPALLDALRHGNFYSSTGPIIQDLRLQAGKAPWPTLEVVCSPCSEIVFYTCGPRGQRQAAPSGATLTRSSLPLRQEQVYVRVECRDAQGGCAWTNPIYVDQVLAD